MPDIKSAVGEPALGGVNKTHDVALVQAMLRLVKNAKGMPYLAGNYDGVYGNQTKNAITTFQQDQKLVVIPPLAGAGKAVGKGPAPKVAAPPVVKGGGEKPGLVGPNSPTLQKLSALLPNEFKTMRVIENTKTVYLEAGATDLAASRLEISGYAQFDKVFRDKVLRLVDQVYQKHKIVLWVTKTGWRRTFADQAKEVMTKAGPGESNHNFGRATDIGFRNFRWVQGGAAIKENDWLNTLQAASPAKAGAFWDARDAIAKQVGLHRLGFERVHLQDFDQSTVSNVNALVKLLNTVGTMKWSPRYQSDLGCGGALFEVGTAKQIWAGQATVNKAMLAKALTAKTKKEVKETDVTPEAIEAMKRALKADFEAADSQWIKWSPAP